MIESKITFTSLRNPKDGKWGVRGDKAHPGERPPLVDSIIVVTKKDESTARVLMGDVIAEGDEYWIAKHNGWAPDDDTSDADSIAETQREADARIEQQAVIHQQLEEQHRLQQVEEDEARLAEQRGELEPETTDWEI
tara:strand:+ start:1068 stop:1478 length:411 start_codon:yes stop_codon:yes gene_type:complete